MFVSFRGSIPQRHQPCPRRIDFQLKNRLNAAATAKRLQSHSVLEIIPLRLLSWAIALSNVSYAKPSKHAVQNGAYKI